MFAGWPISRKVSAAAGATAHTPTEEQIKLGTYKFISISIIEATYQQEGTAKQYYFWDKNPFDGNWQYVADNEYGCGDTSIHLAYGPQNNGKPVSTFNNDGADPTKWNARLEARVAGKNSGTSSVCIDIGTQDWHTGLNPDLSTDSYTYIDTSGVSNINKRKLIFYYPNAPDSLDTLMSFGSDVGAFPQRDIQPTPLNPVYSQKSDIANPCTDTAVVLPSNKVRWYQLKTTKDNGFAKFKAPDEVYQEGCYVRDINRYDTKIRHDPNTNQVIPEDWQNMDIVPPDDAATMAIVNKVHLAVDYGGGNGDSLSGYDCKWSLGSPLTWILCPIYNAFYELMQSLDTMIDHQLTLNTSYFDSNDPINNPTGVAFHNAWSAFYTMSLIVLVLIGMIMVFSQAFSVGPFDAYTIRKVMPRIIIAVIGMTLSWSIMQYLVDLSNIAGNSMRAMIYYPFSSLQNPVFSVGTMAAVLLGGGAAIGVVGLLGVLAIVGAGALSLLVGVSTIIFRVALVMILAVLAPVAIVCFILPNTQRIWKLWSSNFLRALVVFPIITGMIAAGAAMSRVFTATDQSAFNQIAGFASTYVPYFMLPLAFRLAGGTIGSLNGVLKNKTAPMTAGLNKFRNKRAVTRARNGAARAQSAKIFQGNLMKKDGTTPNFRGRINNGAQRTALLGAAGRSGASIFRPKKAKGIMERTKNQVEERDFIAQFSNPGMQPGIKNLEILQALADTGIKSHEDAMEYFAGEKGGNLTGKALRDSVAQYEYMKRELGPRAERFGIMAQVNTENGFLDDSAGLFTSLLKANNMNEYQTHQDFRLAKRIAANAGRHDISNIQDESGRAAIRALANPQRQNKADGTAETQNEATERVTTEQNASLRKEARDRTTPQQLANATESVVEVMALGDMNELKELKTNTEKGDATQEDHDKHDEALAAIANKYDQLYRLSPAKAKIYGVGNEAMGNMGVMNYDYSDMEQSTGANPRKDGHKIPVAGTGGDQTVKQLIDEKRDTSERFAQIRREEDLTPEERDRRDQMLGQQAGQGGGQKDNPFA